MIYLASPYSHADGDIYPPWISREGKYLLVMQAVAILCKRGLPIYSPILHCHEVAKVAGFPTDAQFWVDYNHDFIRASTEVYVLCLPGWELSKGVKEEMDYAKSIKKPVKLLLFNETYTDLSSPYKEKHQPFEY